MASNVELGVLLKPDFKRFEKDLERNGGSLEIDVGAGKSKGGGKSVAQDSNSKLGVIAKGIGGIVAVIGILSQLRVIVSILEVLFSVVNLIIVKLLQFIGLFDIPFSDIVRAISDWIGKAIEWIKSLPERIWNFLKSLPGMIGRKLQEIFSFLPGVDAPSGPSVPASETFLRNPEGTAGQNIDAIGRAAGSQEVNVNVTASPTDSLFVFTSKEQEDAVTRFLGG